MSFVVRMKDRIKPQWWYLCEEEVPSRTGRMTPNVHESTEYPTERCAMEAIVRMQIQHFSATVIDREDAVFADIMHRIEVE